MKTGYEVERDRLRDEMKAMLDTAEKENRDLSRREAARGREIERDIEELDERIARHNNPLQRQFPDYPDDEPEQRNDGFFGFDDGRRTDVEDALLEEMRSVKIGEVRALSTSISIAPQEFNKQFFDRLRAVSVMLQSGIRVIQTDRKSAVYPVVTADVSPAWTAEAGTITPGDPTLSTVTATPHKLAHLVQMSNELIDDSEPAALDILRNHLMAVLAVKLDAGLLEGSGTPPEPTGLKNVSGKQTAAIGANGATPTLDSIADGIALLEAVNVPRERMRIVMHPRNVAALRKAKASTAGSYLWKADPAVSSPTSIWGVPVFSTPQLGIAETQGSSSVTNSIYIYDVENVIYVNRQDIVIELDRSRLFNSDQSELRAKLRGDLISPNPTAIVRLTGALP
jgi:HK97 family phage major capsid protein